MKQADRLKNQPPRKNTPILLALLLVFAACGGQDEAVEWGYRGEGAPENWASLSEDYATCRHGRQQSPIDITAAMAPPAIEDRGSLSFSYSLNAQAVHNDGNSVTVDYPEGNTLIVGDRTFQLKSAHLHAPSEHLIGGASFAAELHLVHAHDDGTVAVVGQLFELGEPSPAVQSIIGGAPEVGSAQVGDLLINAGDYTPNEYGYYRYERSKTTPPCHEQVLWYVLGQSSTISAGQVDSLLDLTGGPNNRPVQPIGDRMVIRIAG